MARSDLTWSSGHPRLPIFTVENGRIFNRTLCVWVPMEQAERNLATLPGMAAEAMNDDLAEVYQAQLADLIAAVREARAFTPTPPASRVVAQYERAVA